MIESDDMLLRQSTIISQQQAMQQAGPSFDFFDPVVDLNASTMFNIGTTEATLGQTIETWGNAIEGNDVTGAAQSISGRRPIVVDENGARAVQFDGVDDFLEFPNVPVLAPSTSDSWTWTIFTGDVTDDSGAMVHKGHSTARHYGFFYFTDSRWHYYTYNQNNLPSWDGDFTRQVWTITYDASTAIAVSYKNGQQFAQANVLNNITSDLPALIGARQNNSAGTAWTFYYQGTIRRIMYHDKALTAQEVEDLYNEIYE